MKIIYFSKTIAAYDLKVSGCIDLYDFMSHMNIKGQGHSLTLANGHSVFKIKSYFSQKLLDYLKASSGSSGTKKLNSWAWSHDQDGSHAHIVKSHENLFLQNQLSDGLETWCVASST